MENEYRGVIPESCLCVSRFFFLRGKRSEEAAAGTRSRTATSDYCLAQLIIIIIIIILALYIVTLFTQRCHKNVENLEVILKYLTLKHTIHID